MDILDNVYVSTILTIFLIVYGGLARQNVPYKFLQLFDNELFRILVITLIAYKANHNPQLSVLLAIGFVISLNFLSEISMQESFKQLEHFVQLEHFNQEKRNN